MARVANRFTGHGVKICFVCTEYPPGSHGGVGTFVQIMARALVQRGHRVLVVGVYPKGYEAPDYEDDAGVRVWRIRESGRRFGWVAARYRLFRTVCAWVARGEVDVVEASDSYGWFAGWPRLAVPLVTRAHGCLTYYAHEMGQRVAATGHRLEAWSYHRSDAWVSVSEHTARLTRRLFRLPRPADAVLHNPVPVPERVTPYSDRQGRTVVFTGTLTPKKGIQSLIDAWPVVLARCPDAQLHVFGKGRWAGADCTTAAELTARLPREARSSVTLHGHHPRPVILEALDRAKVAVFPSFSETFGFCATEAMAAQCPTIYTRRSCGPEIVRDGIDGLLVDPANPPDIASAIVRVLSDHALANRLSGAGRARVEQAFGLEPLVAQNEAFFGRVTNGRGKGDGLA